jgi:hypothetical protein
MKNRDRDDKHSRRRTVGDEEEDPDGREVAEALYGGFDDSKSSDPNDGDR